MDVPITAQRLRHYNNGQVCPPIDALRIIKRGVPVLSNSEVDALFHAVYQERRYRFDEVIYSFFRNKTPIVRTSTFLAKTNYDEKLGESLAHTDRAGWTIVTVVPAICRGEINLSFGSNLTRENFELTIDQNNRTATIVLDEKDVKVMELLRRTEGCGPYEPRGRANDSTLWVPDARIERKERYGPDDRSLYTIEAPWAGLIARSFSELTWGIIYASDMPNSVGFRLPMLMKAT